MVTRISRRAALVGGGAALVASNSVAIALEGMTPRCHCRPQRYAVFGHVRSYGDRWGMGVVRGVRCTGEDAPPVIFLRPELEAAGNRSVLMGTRVACMVTQPEGCCPRVLRFMGIDPGPDPLWEQRYSLDIVGYDLKAQKIHTIAMETFGARCRPEVFEAAGISELHFPMFAVARLGCTASGRLEVRAIESHRPGTRWYRSGAASLQHPTRPSLRLSVDS